MLWITCFRLTWRRLVLLTAAGVLLLLAISEGQRYYWARETEEVIEAWSWAVAGRVIVIDPGHGGVDGGAVGKTGVTEKELNLQVARRLGRLLSEAGAAVILTREKDEDLADPGTEGLLERKRQDLMRRVALVRDSKADLLISIHVNSFPSSRWWGAQTFYWRESEEGRKLAEAIQEELVRVLGNNRRKAKGEVFYLLETVDVPAVMVEMGFISNPREEQLLQDAVYQEKIARAIYGGVVRYFARAAGR